MMVTTAQQQQQFQNAITRYIDSAKPDQLARGQIEQLNLCWEQHDNDVGVASGNGGEDESLKYTWNLNGTLTVSSEYISIAIRAIAHCKIRANKNDEEDANNASACDNNIPDDDVGRVFENKFYIRLSVTAKLLPLGGEEEVKGEEKEKMKMHRKERATQRKLHVGMLKRLQSDRLIRCLLLDDEKHDTKQNANNSGSDDMLLCEALILQNPMHNTSNTHCQSSTSGGGGELEERVNVNDGTLEGIRKAIFSHTEDNLDVFELLLNMPYLPRSCRGGDGDGSSATTSTQGTEYSNIQTKTRDMLGDRVYLRLLEDAMFDSCEREWEGDMLDDLNISSDHAANDNNNNEEEEVATDSSKRRRRRQKS